MIVCAKMSSKDNSCMFMSEYGSEEGFPGVLVVKNPPASAGDFSDGS